MRAIRVTEYGGPETLKLAHVPDPEPGAAERIYDVLAAGVNYADTHATEDSYLSPQPLPMIPGLEVLVAGDDGRRRIGLVDGGGYATRIAVNPDRLFVVPEQVDDSAALAMLVQGVTAWHLLRTSAVMRQGDSVVVHAGAGGVGIIAIQLAKRWGAARVIATASTEEKRQLAVSLGADVAIDSTAADLADTMRAANGGRRVDVVLEMGGGPTFDASLSVLAPLGRLAMFGMASGVEPKLISPAKLMINSSSVTGFWMIHVARRPAMYAEAMHDLLGMVDRKELLTHTGGVYPLQQAGEAHRALRSRKSVGKLILDTTV